MKVYLVHHANRLDAERDADKHLSERGRAEADRLGARLKALGAAPARILHSEKIWTKETAERIAAVLGLEDRTTLAEYPVGTGDPIAPFMEEIEACARNNGGDIMMAGHVDYLLRSASQLLCGDETVRVVEFKPGNGTAFCLEQIPDAGNQWAVTFGWRQDHAPG